MEVGGLTLKKSNLQDITIGLTQPLLVNGRGGMSVAGCYDVDAEHYYIMTKALRSYRQHRSRETSDNKPQSITSVYDLRDVVLSGRKHITGRAYRSKTQTSATAISKTDTWRPDAISEVQKANPAELIISSPKKVLNSNVISLSMDHSKQKPKPSPKRRATPGGRSQAQPIPQTQRQPRPQSCYAFSCPQPRSARAWPWNQHYGKDTWPWSRDNQPNTNSSSPRRRQLRATSDTSANRLMTMSVSSADGQSSSSLQHGDSVFGSSSHTAKRDYFVIHPDWVSESLTVQKLTLKDRKSRPVTVAPPVSRRCRSAPPPRFRNPITWET